MMQDMTYSGSIINIRPKQFTDAANDYQWRADEELATLDATVPIRIDFQEYLNNYQEEIQYRTPWTRRFAIVTKDNVHIGNCMYYDINYSVSKSELGILIGDRDYWNSGYGTDAVNTLLRHIFTDTPIDLVYLHTLSWNYRAQISFKKSGFNSIRNVKRSGLDFIYMEINRQDWGNSYNKLSTISEY